MDKIITHFALLAEGTEDPGGFATVEFKDDVTSKPECLARGERMPLTPEQFTRLAEKYEKALLREKEENSRLRAKLNESKQKYQKARQEQREKDAHLLMLRTLEYNKLSVVLNENVIDEIVKEMLEL